MRFHRGHRLPEHPRQRRQVLLGRRISYQNADRLADGHLTQPAPKLLGQAVGAAQGPGVEPVV